MTLECQQKVDEFEKSRLEHAKMMQEEFIEMRKGHQMQLFMLNKKYAELEKLFSERPSRAEDLSKIKELMNMQFKK